MKLAIAIGLLMVPLALGVASAHTTACVARATYILLDSPAPGDVGEVYHVDYAMDMDLSGDDWVYVENGVKAGVQTGADHVVLGTTWGHDHRCRQPIATERADTPLIGPVGLL